jgi:DNA-binding transcriptional LysR family regulator
LSIRILLGGTIALIDDLRARRIDLGFVRLTGSTAPEDIDQEVLFEDSLVVIASANSSLARRRKIKLADLVEESWTWSSPGTMLDSIIINAFRAGGLMPPRAAIYAESISLKIKLAASGRFLAFVPAPVLRYAATDGLIKVLLVAVPTYQPSGLITLKNRTLSSPAWLFVRYAREMSRPLASLAPMTAPGTARTPPGSRPKARCPNR